MVCVHSVPTTTDGVRTQCANCNRRCACQCASYNRWCAYTVCQLQQTVCVSMCQLQQTVCVSVCQLQQTVCVHSVPATTDGVRTQCASYNRRCACQCANCAAFTNLSATSTGDVKTSNNKSPSKIIFVISLSTGAQSLGMKEE
jgi:hypothetical protein